MKKLVVIFTILGLLGALLSTWVMAQGNTQTQSSDSDSTAPKIKVKLETLKVTQTIDNLIQPGIVSALNDARLSFVSGGRLISRRVRVGDKVNAGDTLAKLDSTGFAIGIRAANASYQAQKEQRDQLKRDANRARQLRKEGALTSANLEKIESGLHQAESGLKAAKHALRESKRQRGESVLRAPFSGVITATYAKPGEIMGPGQAIVHLVGQDGYEIILNLPKESAKSISIESKVKIENQSSQAEGKIRKIVLNASGDRGLHAVVIDVEKEGFSNNENVNVHIELLSEDKILVPLESIIDPAGQEPFIWVVHDKRTTKRPVKLGRLYKNRVAVEGLKANEKIVVSGQHRLLEGDQVDVH